MRSFRYYRWDGSQQVFAPDQERLLDELSDELLAHGDVRRALRQLYQRGMRGPEGQRLEGLRDWLERLRNQRREQLRRYNLDSLMEDLKQRLQKVVDTERQGVQQRLDEARQRLVQEGKDPAADPLMQMLEQRAQRSQQKLDGLPSNLPGAVKELSQYDFMDPEAQRQFQELLDMLKSRMLDSFAKDLRQSIQAMTPEQMAQIREMLKALNQMLRQQAQGGTPDFQGFMQQFGHMFGPNPPQSLEELMERLARQMAQMGSLLDSLSPQQRREMEQLLESVMDPATMREMAELATYLSERFSLDELRKQYRFLGEESVTLDEAMDLMGHLQNMDDLEQKLQDIAHHGNIQDLDPQQLEEVLGQDARRNLEQLQRLAKMLEEAGYVQRKGDRLELTPRGIRRIAHRALKEVFVHLRKDRVGSHDVVKKGIGHELSGETKPFEFGDPFDLDLEETVLNGILRGGPGTPVHLQLQDFAINQREYTTQAATVLLLDQSRSMGLFGSFTAAKKVALALYALIATQFPRDVMYVVGFSDYAMEIKRDELPNITWNAWVSGTNMHHALMLSRKLLGHHKGATRQVLMITDGEPTAHLEGDRAYFSYPPSYRTIQETLKEVRRCTQEGIIINTFMLEGSYSLLDFVDRITRINRGRAFYTTPDRLGEYVLVDYMVNRRKRIVA